MNDHQVRALIDAMKACTIALVESNSSARPDASKIVMRLYDGIHDAKEHLG